MPRGQKICDLVMVPCDFAGYRGLEFHLDLLKDRVRTGSFRKAILKVVKKGDVVADLGGGTGVLSLFSAMSGAGKVYMIESGTVIHAARGIVKDNRFGRKIVPVHKRSFLTRLPEKVDVIVSECIGYFALGGNMLSAVADLRNRALKEGGRMIPRSISLFIAPVRSRRHYRQIQAWAGRRVYGLDLSYVKKLISNNIFLAQMAAKDLIAAPEKVATINLVKDDPNEILDIRTSFSVKKAGTFHGFCGWFEVDLCEGVSFSTSPVHTPTVWRQTFFPLTREVMLQKGSTITLDLQLKRAGNDSCCCMDWGTRVSCSKGRGYSVSFKQSTRKSFPFNFNKQCKKAACDIAVNGKVRIEKIKEAMAVGRIEGYKIKKVK